jgi:hypothetical protein
VLLEQKQWRSILIKIKIIEVVNVFLHVFADTVFLRMQFFVVYYLLNTTRVLSVAETAAEEFKEVVKSYEAIKLERKNNAN